MAAEFTSILVVEDEPLIRFAIVDYLQDEGFQVFEAANSTDAITQLELHPDIQAMFTDVDMPGGVTGLLLSKAVRGRWPPIHIIVTSGKSHFTTEELPLRATFVSKPYDPAEIVAGFRKLVDS
jgi:CheY-like chemotaxis protein